jgi:hypothetical protein
MWGAAPPLCVLAGDKVAAAAAGLSKNRAREGGSDEKGCWLGNRGLKSGRRSL